METVDAALRDYAYSQDGRATAFLRARSAQQLRDIATGIHAHLDRPEAADVEREVPGTPRDSRDIHILPLDVGGMGVVAGVERSAPHRCRNAIAVGRGRFVHGDDNEVFGRWNALVSAAQAGRIVTVFPGHGGEIVPGRLDDHVERLRDNLRTGHRRPVQMDIDVSMACPSACTFCFSAAYRATRGTGLLMSRALLRDMILRWAEEGVRVIRFDGGGDPLTHPYLPEAVELAGGLGLRTAVLTAGDLLRDRQFRAFVQARTYVRVSLNAGSNRVRAAVHRSGNQNLTLNRVLTSVRALADLRQKVYGQNGRPHMILGATSMIAPTNCDDTFATAVAAREAGFDHLSFRVILGKEHKMTFTQAEQDQFLEQAARVRTELVDEHFQVFFPTRSLTDQDYRPAEYFSDCMACTHRVLLEVGHDTDTAAIVPCGRYRGHGFQWRPELDHVLKVMGHLRTDVRLRDVWLAPRMRELVRSFPQTCEDCIDRSANLFFGHIHSVLRTDPRAVFFRYSMPEEPPRS